MHSETSIPAKPLVIFIHGIAAHRLVFLYLQWYFRRKGFQTRNYGYRSVFKTIPWHSDRFVQFLKQIEDDSEVDSFHIVAHSMGGIVTRQALLNFRPSKLGRFLMLGTPNQGSSAARKLSAGIFRFSKTLAQISDAENSYVRNLDFPNGIEAGAIFGTVDRVVTRESSQWAEGAPFLEFYSGHNDLLIRPTTAKAAVEFLETGKFPSVEESSESPAKMKSQHADRPKRCVST
ncbi:MAG: alpha/beta fold hydrolase [Planctomycetota bacterium]